jgi:hypothetical protein
LAGNRRLLSPTIDFALSPKRDLIAARLFLCGSHCLLA